MSIGFLALNDNIPVTVNPLWFFEKQDFKSEIFMDLDDDKILYPIHQSQTYH